MAKLISQGVHRYNGVWLHSGVPFETLNEEDADDLVTIGYARRAPTEAPTYATREMVAQTSASDALAIDTGEVRKKRAYTRRDIVAAQ
jgi:hypothetical protein